MVFLVGLCLPSGATQPQVAAALHDKRMSFESQRIHNASGKSLSLQSQQGDSWVDSDIYAVVEHPFDVISSGFSSASAVCELLSLHLFVRSCTPSTAGHEQTLTVVGGSKRLPVGVLRDLMYKMQVEFADNTYTRTTLFAAEGPFSTRDYRMVFEAEPIDAMHTFVHFSYAYGYGTAAKLAMQVYQATTGRTKIGFSVVGHSADGQPAYVRGERGALERNAMRSYLCLLAFASVQSGEPAAKRDARLLAWFALTERYADQLHEINLNEYLSEKREDLDSLMLRR